MKAALRTTLKKSADAVIRTIGGLLPKQLVAGREPMAPAVLPFQLPLPRNAAQLPPAYLAQFDNERSLPERYFFHLRNVQVSWHGVVFQNLQMFRPSVLPASVEAEFKGSFLLRQWWKRRARPLPANEVVGLAYGPWAVGNYYHWIVDTLPRLLLLQRQYPGCRLLMPAGLPVYAAKTAAMFGFERQLLVQPGEIVTVPQLVMPDYAAHPGYQDPALMREVRETVWRAVGARPRPPGQPGRRVYVSRARQRIRRLLNEAAIEPLLRQYGFETVYFETLSFEEQVQLLLETDVLVGIHGAGLTNTLFMRPNTTVVEFMSDSSCNPCYYHLASGLGLNYNCLPSRSAEQGAAAHNNSDLTVDASQLAQLFTTLFPTS
ncbi:glycosyltransferase family 61 protein [Hymenobacter sp. ASUV-10]|uniref:Glycosyltransferase family 61 protein n=1 Tax=Hymenobacter aranciens TaxID=3063996 RepID=A0ABT9B8N5_9BACT|nr:glycosyltransferase family 61 protein [Hymenobacter sp. ASUV-10]MDO7874165.1 glycosyltransferase family 61 protein [Hymenobacter sp. ASUV-10]